MPQNQPDRPRHDTTSAAGTPDKATPHRRPNANNPADEWDYANAAGNSFMDYYLKDSGAKPDTSVTAQTTVCLPGQTRQTYTAPSWDALHDSAITLSSTRVQTTSNTAASAEGPASDPIAHSGCLSTNVDNAAALWTFPVATPYTLMGQPTLNVDFTTTGTDAELNAKLWDVDTNGISETLVGRAAYRYTGAANTPQHISYQISGNPSRFVTRQRGTRPPAIPPGAPDSSRHTMHVIASGLVGAGAGSIRGNEEELLCRTCSPP